MNRYERVPQHDRRIRRGDDFAGDAWRNVATGEIRYTAVGHSLNDDTVRCYVCEHVFETAAT